MRFLYGHGRIGLVTLGFVFLAVTGGEALYADLGHFGRRPIQTAWFGLVLPALVINYFGQGALALLWQIYSRCFSLQIHFLQCGHLSGGNRAMSSMMAWRVAGNVG